MTHVYTTQPLEEIESVRGFHGGEESFVCCHRYHVTGVILMTVRPRYREGASCSLARGARTHIKPVSSMTSHSLRVQCTHQLSNFSSSSGFLFLLSAFNLRAWG